MVAMPQNSSVAVRATSGIPTPAYYQPSFFEQESANLFTKGWQFVAMRDELANNRDFVRVDLPGDSIVVQNFRGELRAFKNVCTHRLSLIQTANRGNRHLMCAYHGWTFDAEGRPIGMVRRHGFSTAEDDAYRLCLTRYRVATCGKFVFIARDPAAPRLEDYLGAFRDVLDEIGAHIGDEIAFESVCHAANWKLLVENVLECYHCSIVHPETFVAGLGVGRKPIADVQSAGLHSSSHFPRTPTRREALRKRMVSHLDGRKFAHDSFFHIYIFPNLFISSTEGTAFYVGHALPRAVDRTDLRVRLFEPNVEYTATGRARQNAINQAGISVGLNVIEEDRAILENVQQGMAIADRPMTLGNEEVRIRAFHEAYRVVVAEEPVSPPVPTHPSEVV